jgi:hypothetical protein
MPNKPVFSKVVDPRGIFMRHTIKALVCITCLATGLRADEYKGAVVKGVEKGKFVFEFDDKEFSISPGSTAFEAFDIDGNQLRDFPNNYRVMKAGNVVDLVTTKKRNMEYVKEIHLVKGELLETGKATTTTGGRAAKSASKSTPEQTKYTGATIKSVDQKKVVLVVGEKEIPVVAGGSMKAFDASGHQLRGRGQNFRVLKEGNQVDVTTFKGGNNVEVIREIHLVQGALQDN